MGFLAKSELLNELYKIGESKAKLTWEKFLVLGMFAGMFVGIGGYIYIVVIAGMKEFNPILTKIVAGLCFTFGIFAVVVAGADLFTGNILMEAPLLGHKITLPKMLKNWVLIYIFNFLGSICVALLAYYSNLVSPEMVQYVHKMVEAKVTTAFIPLLLKGIGCNFLVCCGVWMSYAARDVISKYYAAGIPVVIFLVLGFEHSVANMFYFALAFLLSEVTVGSIAYNLIPVTMGNVIGGCIIAAGYYYAYRENCQKCNE